MARCRSDWPGVDVPDSAFVRHLALIHTEMERLLRDRLGLTVSAFESLAGLVQSQLHVSIERLLHES